MLSRYSVYTTNYSPIYTSFFTPIYPPLLPPHSCYYLSTPSCILEQSAYSISFSCMQHEPYNDFSTVLPTVLSTVLITVLYPVISTIHRDSLPPYLRNHALLPTPSFPFDCSVNKPNLSCIYLLLLLFNSIVYHYRQKIVRHSITTQMLTIPLINPILILTLSKFVTLVYTTRDYTLCSPLVIPAMTRVTLNPIVIPISTPAPACIPTDIFICVWSPVLYTSSLKHTLHKL